MNPGPTLRRTSVVATIVALVASTMLPGSAFLLGTIALSLSPATTPLRRAAIRFAALGGPLLVSTFLILPVLFGAARLLVPVLFGATCLLVPVLFGATRLLARLLLPMPLGALLPLALLLAALFLAALLDQPLTRGVARIAGVDRAPTIRAAQAILAQMCGLLSEDHPPLLVAIVPTPVHQVRRASLIIRVRIMFDARRYHGHVFGRVHVLFRIVVVRLVHHLASRMCDTPGQCRSESETQTGRP